MSIGAQTAVVNGQRFAVPTTAAYVPQGYGPQTTGVPSTVPQQPPAIGAAGGTTGSGVSANVVAATQNPHSFKWSPLWWAVLFLVGSIVLMKGVHWRETTLAGFDERANAGPLRENAGADVD